MATSIIDNMPYKHVSNMYTRTMINAYDMLLNVMRHNSTIDDVVAWVKAYIGYCDNAFDTFYSIDDIDMCDYMLFLSLHMSMFAYGTMRISRDIEDIRYHYSIYV